MELNTYVFTSTKEVQYIQLSFCTLHNVHASVSLLLFCINFVHVAVSVSVCVCVCVYM